MLKMFLSTVVDVLRTERDKIERRSKGILNDLARLKRFIERRKDVPEYVKDAVDDLIYDVDKIFDYIAMAEAKGIDSRETLYKKPDWLTKDMEIAGYVAKVCNPFTGCAFGTKYQSVEEITERNLGYRLDKDAFKKFLKELSELRECLGRRVNVDVCVEDKIKRGDIDLLLDLLGEKDFWRGYVRSDSASENAGLLYMRAKAVEEVLKKLGKL